MKSETTVIYLFTILEVLMRAFLVLFLMTGFFNGMVATPKQVDAPVSLDELVAKMTFRNLGPFRAGAWISDIAVPQNCGPEYRYTLYVAARNGGVWKSDNSGTTFRAVFDRYGTNSIGAIEVAPGHGNIVWVGTGDDSMARSSYSGNGIWKSMDGGEKFVCMGLRDSHHIGRILIHPQEPDIVYVAVMGHLFSANAERGVFKTVDGGKSWKKSLYINDKVGVVDLVLNPKNPDILYAASYEKERSAWNYEAGGESSRIWRSRDGGDNWQRLAGGLPEGVLGRIGIDVHRTDPRILYAIVQNLNDKPGAQAAGASEFDPFTDHSFDNKIGGEVYRSDDAGDSWTKVSDPAVDLSGKAAYSFNEITVDPQNPDHVFVIGVSMRYSLDGGKTWPDWQKADRFQHNFGDVRTFWMDPDDPRHLMLGSDGGFYTSTDGGRTMAHHYQIPLGEVYHVETDNETPYHIYAGLQDHETWKGPVNGWTGSVGVEDWVITGMWDGMFTLVDRLDPRWLYFTTQFGKHTRVDQSLGVREGIMPQNPNDKAPYRYTWTTPLAMSPHDSRVLYTGGQMVLKSTDRGQSWREISPDLTCNDPDRIGGKGHIQFCTLTTIAESPRQFGQIWAGSDDGRVHVTVDGGKAWRDCTRGIDNAGAPGRLWVSQICPSQHDSQTVYLVKSGFTEDHFVPYVLVSQDLGKSWKRIVAGLPEAPVSTLVESDRSPNLLLVGTDKGLFVSLDRGCQWHAMQGNIPPVPIRYLAIQPQQRDLVVASYGRGVWVTHIAPLEELTPSVRNKPFHLFGVLDQPLSNQSDRAHWGNYEMTGDNHLRTDNEPEGIKITIYISRQLDKPLNLVVKDGNGQVKKEWLSEVKPGLYGFHWTDDKEQPGAMVIELSNGQVVERQTARLTDPLFWPLLRR